MIKARADYAKTGVKTRKEFDDSLEAQIAYEDSHAIRASYDEAKARLAEVEAQIANLTGKFGKVPAAQPVMNQPTKVTSTPAERRRVVSTSATIKNGRISVNFLNPPSISSGYALTSAAETRRK